MSPRSLSCAYARPNHSRAFSIFRSDKEILTTVQITNGLSFVFRRASAERVFLAGRGSDQTDSVHERPDSGHSCKTLLRELRVRYGSWNAVVVVRKFSLPPLFPSLTHIHTPFLDWNENVVPRLLAIFRSVEREIGAEAQKRR